jgi:hypothetical protein
MSESFGTKKLQELGSLKLHLLRSARELSIQQFEVMQSDDVATLLTVLSRKSEILDTLRTLQKDLDPYRDQQPEDRQWDSAEERLACRKTFEEIDRLLEELTQMDNRALEQMTQQRDAMASQIAQFATAEAVQNAYATSFLGSDDNSQSGNSLGFSLEG